MGKNKRQWVSSEARSLIECTGLDDPPAAMCMLVYNLLQEAEQKEAPVNLPLVASFKNIVEIRTELIKDAAMLVPTSEGLRILVNKTDPVGRRNFSAAHEVCHTLFPSYANHPVTKVDKLVGRFSFREEEEYLCDLGASHLLLPPTLILSKIQTYGFCIDAIIQLANDFQSSLEASAIAWTQASPWQCAVIFSEENLKPSEVKRKDQLILPTMEDDFKLQPELRIALACVSSDFPLFLPKYKSVKRDGPIYNSLATQSRTNGIDILEFGKEHKTVHAESLYVPYRKDGVLRNRVVSMLSLT